MMSDTPPEPIALPIRRRWTHESRVRFLDHLAASGDVRAAARSCGLSRQSVYRLRARDRVFAQAWDVVLARRREILFDRFPVDQTWRRNLTAEGRLGDNARRFAASLERVLAGG